MTARARNRVLRRGRTSSNAQAVVEMAMLFPILIALVCGFLGIMILAVTNQQLRTATALAAQSSLDAPRGNYALAMQYASQSYTGSMHFTSYLQPLNAAAPVTCTGGYYSGVIDTSSIRCTASVVLHLDRSPVGLFWMWSNTMTVSSDAQPSMLRQCAVPTGQQAGSC